MQSVTHSAIHSAHLGKLQNVAALTMNIFGKAAVWIPRYVRGPSAHLSLNDCPPSPRISILVSGPVTASKPVAKIMTSSSYSASRVLTPFEAILPVGGCL